MRARVRVPPTGMTLVEVMVAMFVLVVIFSAALGAIIQVRQRSISARNRLRATAIINARMEEMRAMPFASLVTSLANSSFQRGTETNTAFTGTNGYTFNWTRLKQAAVDSDEGNTLCCVVVTVSWSESGRPKQLQTLSYFSASGVSTRQVARRAIDLGPLAPTIL